MKIKKLFNIKNKVVVITGAFGFLGLKFTKLILLKLIALAIKEALHSFNANLIAMQNGEILYSYKVKNKQQAIRVYSLHK